ncbi:MAG: hypothetical protein ACOCTG_05735, partial [Bacteroidota bacterium]
DRTLRKIGRDDLLAACRSNGELSTEKAVVMADLLREEAELLLLEERSQEAATAARQALWLYEAAIEHGAALPLDIYQRIERMREVAG